MVVASTTRGGGVGVSDGGGASRPRGEGVGVTDGGGRIEATRGNVRAAQKLARKRPFSRRPPFSAGTASQRRTLPRGSGRNETAHRCDTVLKSPAGRQTGFPQQPSCYNGSMTRTRYISAFVAVVVVGLLGTSAWADDPPPTPPSPVESPIGRFLGRLLQGIEAGGGNGQPPGDQQEPAADDDSGDGLPDIEPANRIIQDAVDERAPAGREQQRELAQAQRLLHAGDEAAALTVLQRLLDGEEDTLVLTGDGTMGIVAATDSADDRPRGRRSPQGVRRTIRCTGTGAIGAGAANGPSAGLCGRNEAVSAHAGGTRGGTPSRGAVA